MNTNRKMKLTFAVAAWIALQAGLAPAQLIYSENFESLTPGTINAQAGWGVSGGTADANVVNNGAVAFQGSQYLAMGNLSTATTVFQTGLETIAINQSSNFVWTLHIRATSFADGARNGVDIVLNADGGPERMVHTSLSRFGSVRGVTNNGADIVTVGSMNAGEWYRLIYEIRPSALNYDMTMIRDSDNSTNAPTTTLPFDQVLGGSVLTLNDIRFDLVNAPGFPGNDWLVDDVRFSVVPEPNTMVVVGLGALLLALGRGRAKHQG